jgi:hypothetical protein
VRGGQAEQSGIKVGWKLAQIDAQAIFTQAQLLKAIDLAKKRDIAANNMDLSMNSGGNGGGNGSRSRSRNRSASDNPSATPYGFIRLTFHTPPSLSPTPASTMAGSSSGSGGYSGNVSVYGDAYGAHNGSGGAYNGAYGAGDTDADDDNRLLATLPPLPASVASLPSEERELALRLKIAQLEARAVKQRNASAMHVIDLTASFLDSKRDAERKISDLQAALLSSSSSSSSSSSNNDNNSNNVDSSNIGNNSKNSTSATTRVQQRLTDKSRLLPDQSRDNARSALSSSHFPPRLKSVSGGPHHHHHYPATRSPSLDHASSRGGASIGTVSSSSSANAASGAFRTRNRNLSDGVSTGGGGGGGKGGRRAGSGGYSGEGDESLSATPRRLQEAQLPPPSAAGRRGLMEF